MATPKPTTKNSPAIAKAKSVHNNSATAYAPPHKMTGEKVNPQESLSVKVDPNTMLAKDFKPGKPTGRVSLGNPNADDVKTSGIEMRGAGAATKGRMSRGPMA